MSFFRNIGTAVLDLLIPPHCHICKCHIPNPEKLHICNSCNEKLPLLTSPFCTVCGIPFLGAGDNHKCGRCITSPPPYKAARAAMLYEGSCRDMIHSFKYQQRWHLRRPLALITDGLLGPFVSSCKPDLIIPVPLHPARLRKRGFNQSVLLGETLSSLWDLPMLRQGLKRTVSTRPQIELSRREREENLKGVFKVTDPSKISGMNILLLDDVFTTGSTLAECSIALLEASSADIFAVTVAHAP